MLRIFATLRKEMLVLWRDKSGMALLFIMPMFLIILMALIQDAPFKDFQDVKFDISIVDDDHLQLSESLVKALTKSNKFNVSIKKDLTQAREEVNTGKTKVLVHIPKGANLQMEKHASVLVSKLLKQLGLASDTNTSISLQKLNISIYFDPTANKTFKNAIQNALSQFVAKTETEFILQTMMTQLGSTTSDESNPPFEDINFINIKEVSSNTEISQLEKVANSVQHNVPAWTIFAMFFIVIPLGGALLKEREDGSLLRLKLMPGSYLHIQLGKVLFYVIVCVIQFYLMMLVGIYLMPYIGLSSLHMGSSPVALFVLVVCIALAATTYVIMIGSVFRTAQQSLTFGSISVVILSAIGGIWIPIYILPPVMQKIAQISPLNWALTAVNDLFLRDQGLLFILPNILKLLVFSFVCMFLSKWAESKQGRG